MGKLIGRVKSEKKKRVIKMENSRREIKTKENGGKRHNAVVGEKIEKKKMKWKKRKKNRRSIEKKDTNVNEKKAIESDIGSY